MFIESVAHRMLLFAVLLCTAAGSASQVIFVSKVYSLKHLASQVGNLSAPTTFAATTRVNPSAFDSMYIIRVRMAGHYRTDPSGITRS